MMAENITQNTTKPKISVHKFSSCDGCQLAFINAGKKFLELFELVEVVHFAEAGIVNPEAKVDFAFIEGSITNSEEVERIHKIRENSKYLIPIGACATAGGVQALRNMANADEWAQAIYPRPNELNFLPSSVSVATHVKTDFELWGCPPNSMQLYNLIRTLLLGVNPDIPQYSLCLDCKRNGTVCVLVARGMACMGPVTKTGCGVLCPSKERECYECFGPSEITNGQALGTRFKELGLTSNEIARRFLLINNGAPAFRTWGKHFKEESSSQED